MEEAEMADRPVVVGVDGSDGSLNALDWGAAAADTMGVPLEAVHAYSPWIDWALTVPPFDAARYRDLVERTAAGWCEPFADAGIACEAKVVEADAATALLDGARTSNAEFVALGSHGRSNWSAHLLGSITAKVIHHASVPVVVVPAGASFDPGGEIVVGVDGADSSVRALRWAVAHAAATSRPVRAVTVVPPQLWHEQPYFEGHGEIAGGLAALVRDLEGAAGEVLVGDPAGVLEAEADRAAMLVLGTRGHTSIGEIVFGSVSRHCATHCSRPVVIVPAGGE